MKQILLVIVLIIGILSCGMPKEVEYPNENLKIENNMVLYKNKKLNALAEKLSRYSYYLNNVQSISEPAIKLFPILAGTILLLLNNFLRDILYIGVFLFSWNGILFLKYHIPVLS